MNCSYDLKYVSAFNINVYSYEEIGSPFPIDSNIEKRRKLTKIFVSCFC